MQRKKKVWITYNTRYLETLVLDFNCRHHRGSFWFLTCSLEKSYAKFNLGKKDIAAKIEFKRDETRFLFCRPTLWLQLWDGMCDKHNQHFVCIEMMGQVQYLQLNPLTLLSHVCFLSCLLYKMKGLIIWGRLDVIIWNVNIWCLLKMQIWLGLLFIVGAALLSLSSTLTDFHA